MVTLTESATRLAAGGLLTLAVGLVTVSAVPGDVGSSLVLGGTLLLISTAGVEVYAREQEAGRDDRNGGDGYVEA